MQWCASRGLLNITEDFRFKAEHGQTNDVIDMATFNQLRDMDDEDDHEFSRVIVQNYFEQAKVTLAEMDEALHLGDVSTVSRLGHFLKGSSAAIGLIQVKKTCENIQQVGNHHVGNHHVHTSTPSEPQVDSVLNTLSSLFQQVKAENSDAEVYLGQVYPL